MNLLPLLRIVLFTNHWSDGTLEWCPIGGNGYLFSNFPLLVAAFYYLMVTTVMAQLLAVLERHMAQGGNH